MHKKKILRQVKNLIERLERQGTLKPEQKEELDRAAVRINLGLKKRDQKQIEVGIERLVRALLTLNDPADEVGNLRDRRSEFEF